MSTLTQKIHAVEHVFARNQQLPLVAPSTARIHGLRELACGTHIGGYGSMPPTAVTCRNPSQLEAQIAEGTTGPGSLNRPCHWDG